VFRLPHRALPHSQIRESSAQQNHNRFIRLNNFVDRLLENKLMYALNPRLDGSVGAPANTPNTCHRRKMVPTVPTGTTK
jgi:hypothetical protein